MEPKQKKLLIVDDDPSILTVIENIFAKHNYDIVKAKNGQECVKALEAGFRGVLLVDAMMPFMNGWETVKEIVDKNLFEGNVIIMMTALENPPPAIEQLRGYVMDYISKPFNVKKLVRTVDNYSAHL